MKTTYDLRRFRPAVPLLLGCCLGLAAGCVSAEKKAAEEEKDQGEYEYVYTTGSNIPVKIRKGTQRTSDKRTAADQAEVKRTLERMPNQEKRAGGN